MRRRISDHDIEQLLTGRSPGGQPELLAVAEVIGAARTAAYETVPQPSAALAARLDLSDEVSAIGLGEPVAHENSRGTITMRDRSASLGLAAKITAGIGVLALGLTGVGAAGALPGPVQTVFDTAVETAVETVLPQDETEAPVEGDGSGEVVDETLPVGSKEFSTWVREGAQDPDKVGSEFGAAVSEQARELREEKAAERAEERAESGKPPVGKPAGGESAGDESSETTDSDKPGNGNGKPEKPRNENAQGGKP